MSFEGKIRTDHARRQYEGELWTQTEARGHATRRREDDAEEGIVAQNADSMDGFDPFVLIGNRFGKFDGDPGEDLVKKKAIGNKTISATMDNEGDIGHYNNTVYITIYRPSKQATHPTQHGRTDPHVMRQR